jgi:serine/threonine-protein kinase HipA
MLLDGDTMFLADGKGVASTHLLKPEPFNAAAPCMVANEHYCMTLARRVGLPVAPVELRRLPSPVLQIARFDRVRSGNQVRRLHIVDASQALDLPVSYKYERNFGAGRDVEMIREGVSFEKLFSLPMMSRGPARRTILQWAIFQFLIGNSDAHGKNISFFCTRYGLEPTPFYDLVSVLQYDGFLHDIAMGIGDVFDYAKVTPYAWADLIQCSGVTRATAVKVFARVAHVVRAVARQQAASPVYIDDERDMVNAIATFVERQATLILEMIPAILEIDPGLL